MIDEMKSEAAGAYFDVANILAFGLPQDWILQLGKRLKSLHFKDFRLSVGGLQGFCNPFDGDVGWGAVREALRRIGVRASQQPQAHAALRGLGTCVPHGKRLVFLAHTAKHDWGVWVVEVPEGAPRVADRELGPRRRAVLQRLSESIVHSR